MKFTSLLSAVGKGLKIAAPVASIYAGGFTGALGKIGIAVGAAEATAEALGAAKSGAQKSDALINVTVSILKASELVTGHEIADWELFVEGARDIQNGVVKIQKSLQF